MVREGCSKNIHTHKLRGESQNKNKLHTKKRRATIRILAEMTERRGSQQDSVKIPE